MALLQVNANGLHHFLRLCRVDVEAGQHLYFPHLQGRKLMTCRQCQELGQRANLPPDWPCLKTKKQSGDWLAHWLNCWTWIGVLSFHPRPCPRSSTPTPPPTYNKGRWEVKFLLKMAGYLADGVFFFCMFCDLDDIIFPSFFDWYHKLN